MGVSFTYWALKCNYHSIHAWHKLVTNPSISTILNLNTIT